MFFFNVEDEGLERSVLLLVLFRCDPEDDPFLSSVLLTFTLSDTNLYFKYQTVAVLLVTSGGR